MSNILEDLEKYFQETPQEQIMKDWAESEKYDHIGPSVEEFMKNTKLFFKLEENDLLPEQKNAYNNFQNPKYSSGFSLI